MAASQGALPLNISEGCVYYFVPDKFSSREPHYFVVLNHQPVFDRYLILVCATTVKMQTVKRAASLQDDTFIAVLPSHCPFLKHLSVFNCNSVVRQSVENLNQKFSDGKLKAKGKVTQKILDSLRKGVLKSKVVENEIKAMLKAKA